MVFLNRSKHKQWRKEAKKMRRKHLRKAAAQERDQKILEEQRKRESSPRYQRWLKDQEELEKQLEEEELRHRLMNEIKWKKVEEQAQKQWQELQKKLAQAREEKAKQNLKIKLEWEHEQKRLKEELEKKEQEIEKRRILKEKQDKEIEEFLEIGGDTPEHLKQTIETNSGKPLCPFFKKTGTCRFFNSCSRNHIQPTISKIIVIKNFYSHYGLEKTMENEHGSDASLEYELDEMYLHYKEFFYDVVAEMEKIGKIRQFKTCYNHELHLRGNVYVEYSTTREALLAFRTFNSRWYGGKQLSVQFCNIDNWKMAICGLHYSKRCPKGNNCNFMHVFRNPQNFYTLKEQDSRRSFRSQRTHRDRQRWSDSEEGSDSPKTRNWRWSESPERIGKHENTKTKQRSHRNTPRSERKRRKSRSPSRNKSSKLSNSQYERRHMSRSRSSSRKSSVSRTNNSQTRRKSSESELASSRKSASRSRSRSSSRKRSISRSNSKESRRKSRRHSPRSSRKNNSPSVSPKSRSVSRSRSR